MQHDAIIVGGGFAGLAAATYLARARRNVRILDTGKPRNRFAEASHGFLGQDGSNPAEILAIARAQLQAYDSVELTDARASKARVIEDGFAVSLADGEEITARKLIGPKACILAGLPSACTTNCPICRVCRSGGGRPSCTVPIAMASSSETGSWAYSTARPCRSIRHN